jgi:hypothetical protein
MSRLDQPHKSMHNALQHTISVLVEKHVTVVNCFNFLVQILRLQASTVVSELVIVLTKSELVKLTRAYNL